MLKYPALTCNLLLNLGFSFINGLDIISVNSCNKFRFSLASALAESFYSEKDGDAKGNQIKELTIHHFAKTLSI